MRINFDIKYRPEIESGKHQVITRDGTRVRIVCWDAFAGRPILAIVDGDAEVHQYYADGRYATPMVPGESAYDLFILTDAPKYTEYQAKVAEILANVYEINFDNDYAYNVLNRFCDQVLKASKDEIKKKAMGSIEYEEYAEDRDLATNAIGMLSYSTFMNNRSRDEVCDWLNGIPKRIYHSGNVKLPVWKKAYAGTHFTGLAITMDPSGKDYPRLVATAMTDCIYIELNDIINLPKEGEQ